jgi:hypothetical protein
MDERRKNSWNNQMVFQIFKNNCEHGLIFPALELSNVNNSLFSVCAVSLVP